MLFMAAHDFTTVPSPADTLSRVLAANQEHHVAVWSDNTAPRQAFALSLAEHLHALPDIEVLEFTGREIRSIADFSDQLGVQLSLLSGQAEALSVVPTIDGPGGIIEALRERPAYPGHDTAAKIRIYLWHDADALLAADPAAFGAIVDAIAGIAAEAEYASEDLLLIHRGIFVGNSALATYARDARGQFRTWLSDSAGSPALWKVISGVENPPVMVLPIDPPQN